MNNRTWGASMHFAQAVSGPGRPIATALGDARYDVVAAGFGCHSAYVTAIDELEPAIRDAFASGGPACINVEIEMSAMPPDSELLASYG
jgi:acetolactate synthase-1/2/3 large subunit